MDHQGPRHRDPVPRQQLVQVDLVRALHDRIRIVDDHQALGGRAPGELVRVMVDPGRIPDEQRIEARERIDVAAPDDFGAHAELSRGEAQLAQRRPVGRRVRLAGAVEDGDRRRPGRRFPRARAGAARDELAGGVGGERPLLRGELRQAERLHVGEAPLPALPLETRAQQRHAQRGEELLRERLVASRRIVPEVDIHAAGRFRARRERAPQRLSGGAVQQVLRGGLEVAQRLRFRQRPVPARFREQGDVIAAPLVAVGAAEVQHPRRRAVAERGVGKVIARRDEPRPLDRERPVARMIDDDEHAHRWPPREAAAG